MSAGSDVNMVDLGERFCRGDERCLDEIFAELCPRIRGGLRRAFTTARVRNEIGQIMVDAVEYLHEHRGDFDPAKGTLAAWLWTVAYHLAIDLLRSRATAPHEIPLDPQRLAQFVDDRHANGAAEDSAAARREQRDELVHRGLAALSASQRYVLLAAPEAADALVADRQLAVELGIALSTVRSLRARGKHELRRLLLDLGIDEFVNVQRPNAYPSRDPDAPDQDDTKSSDLERGTGNGERGTGNGERGTGNGERGVNASVGDVYGAIRKTGFFAEDANAHAHLLYVSELRVATHWQNHRDSAQSQPFAHPFWLGGRSMARTVSLINGLSRNNLVWFAAVACLAIMVVVEAAIVPVARPVYAQMSCGPGCQVCNNECVCQ